MKETVLFSLLIFTSLVTFAQDKKNIEYDKLHKPYSYKSISFGTGIMSFNPHFLDNRNNSNNLRSMISELSFIKMNRKFSCSIGAGIGSIRNMGTEFGPFESSDLYRLKFSLNPKLVKLFFYETYIYGTVGYNFDYLSNNYKAGYKALNSNVNAGLGISCRALSHLNLFYQFTVNQKLGQDYRTFSQNTFGISIPIYFKVLVTPDF
ncbi:MAG: hypothetical protein H7321_02255 [Bacteroidia bacterium]|nr:hypothetical protein [Bacteroidia bacterium]